MLRIGCCPRLNRTFRPAVLLGVLLIAALLAGCAGEVGTNLGASPDQVGLETLVAEAVITAKASTPQFPTGMPTGLAARTSTPTITPIPSATPEGAQPQSDNPPDSPSGGGGGGEASPTVFITLTPPGMPTRDPNDPALARGEADWSDNFDTDDNWGTYQTDRSRLEIDGGQLRFTMFKAGYGPTWALSWPTVTNFYMEAAALTPQHCAGKDAFGLVFRAPDADRGYRFEIFCDGGYRLIAFDSSGIQTLAGGLSHPAINAGPNQYNRLGVWAENRVIVIHINGVAIAGLEDTTFRAAGRFGFTITADTTEPFTVVFDDLVFWTFE
jgi:hypothetical protein